MSVKELESGYVVVTGASTGIGKVCALRLDQMGFTVFAGVRKPADGEALRETASERLTPLAIDVTQGDTIAAAVKEVGARAGARGLQGLVNNAGIVVAGPLECLPLDELRKQLDVNVLGQVAVTQAFLPLLRLGGGRIVNMGSISGLLASPFTGPYAMSKFAMEAFSDALRMELAPWRIHVALVEPGSIATPIWEKSQQAGAALYDRLPEEGRRLYDPQLRAFREAAARIGAQGIAPDRVAEAVTHALTAHRPRARYLVGRDARLLKMMARCVPERLRDRLILTGMGFNRSRP